MRKIPILKCKLKEKRTYVRLSILHIFFNKSIAIIVSLQIDNKLKSCYTNVAIKKRKGKLK
nr:MAG TPA: hypothetical protein [Caudoviricetes sp.]